MLSKREKIIIEKFVKYHNESGGTVSHDMRLQFKKTLGLDTRGFFDLNPIISKSIAIGLIQYKLPNQTGMTVLTKNGWEFTSFEEYDKMAMNQQEIDKLTIEKLKTDLLNSKRQSRMFIPLTILSFLMGIFTIFSSINSTKVNHKLEVIQQRQYAADSIVNSLKNQLKQTHLDKSQIIHKVSN